MKTILPTILIFALAGSAAHASYWDGCGKYVNQYHDEPRLSKELACQRIKSCKARNACHAKLDQDSASTGGHFGRRLCWTNHGHRSCGIVGGE